MEITFNEADIKDLLLARANEILPKNATAMNTITFEGSYGIRRAVASYVDLVEAAAEKERNRKILDEFRASQTTAVEQGLPA